MNIKNTLLPACALVIGSLGHATELVYTPVNPSFGGSPLNGPYLLNNAQAQNDHEDPSSRRLTQRSTPTALERFTSQLESRLLSQLLSNIQDGNTGSLVTEAFIIDMVDDGGLLTITITDRATGEVSEVVVNGLGPF